MEYKIEITMVIIFSIILLFVVLGSRQRVIDCSVNTTNPSCEKDINEFK